MGKKGNIGIFCKIRDIHLAITEFEKDITEHHGISLNEGMLLCSLKETGSLSSTELSEILKLTTSNTSKIIKSAENKNFIKRHLGKTDKRSMLFSLTPAGVKKLMEIQDSQVDLPQIFRNL